MDEDYARLLRDWLLADPGTPRPRPESDDVVIPLPRLSEENRRRNAADGRRGLGWPRDPEGRNEVEGRTAVDGPVQLGDPESWNEVEGRTAVDGLGLPGAPGGRNEVEGQSAVDGLGLPGAPGGRNEVEGQPAVEGLGPPGAPESRSRVESWTEAEDGDLAQPREPESPAEAEDRGPELLHRPESRSDAEGRPALEGAGQLGDPESRSEGESWSPAQPREPESRSAAEARSRWNHPSNWHRRKAARAEIRDRVAEPEEPSWPPHDPDEEPSRWSPLDEQRPWRELDDAIARSRRQALDAAKNNDDDPEKRSR
ncbi:MAG: hypothetical protein QOI78_872 [Actinomycetota bacterium]|nr:hypothetical protein [Actinomycetota bacterium]